MNISKHVQILVLVLFQSFFLASYAATNQTIFTAIFAHGLGGQAFHGEAYSDFFCCPIIAENGPEWNHNIYGDNAGPEQSCLAQEDDIKVIEKQIETHLQENIVLLGVSKGAATMINTVGWLADNHPSYLNNVKAVILDSPFSCPETVAVNVVKHQIGGNIGECIGSSIDNSCIRPIVKKLETRIYPNYDPQGITPIKSIKQQWSHVDKDMVIVFVHSKKDQLISINDSRVLYLELKKLGFKNLYLIEAVDGAHGNVFWGSDKGGILEKLCLIYLKHDLPLPSLNDKYIESLIKRTGQQMLSAIQPSIKEVNQSLHPWLSWLGLV